MLTPKRVCTDKKDGIFVYLLFLTGFFLLSEISLFVQCNKAYLADFRFVSANLHVPYTVLPGIFSFIAAQLVLHFIYCLFIWGIVKFFAKLFLLSSQQTIVAAIAIWTLGILTILFANQYFYPNSKFSELMSPLFSRGIVIVILNVLLFLCSICVLSALVGCVLSIKKRFLFIALLILNSTVVFFIKPAHVDPINAASKEKPNIFLIGADALRPDFLSHFGDDQTVTPFFDAFLNHSTVFTEAVTPLARTFPSWTSILSGEYPRTVGIRSNLANQQYANLENTLPAILQKNGYETIYATDETRFSNIGKNYGFNHLVTPPVGLNDFLLGTFNDFPFSNLIVNTPLGRWLFPYSYANRPAFITYSPGSFLNLLQEELDKKHSRPIFMSVHFCLTHFPYAWGNVSANGRNAVERYRSSVERVDQQISDFFNLLKQRQLLNHAIVILLSDHGEALELPGDRLTENDLFLQTDKQKVAPAFYPPSLHDEAINKSAGHGTDVLGLSQYHTLLAFRLYGMGLQQRKENISEIVSLLDVKPTVLSFLNLPVPAVEGRSLIDIIRSDGKKTLLPRHIFLESDFSPQAIRTVYPETREVLLAGVHLFQIDPLTTRLVLKDEMNAMIINSKQYADIYGEWMLALYPQNKQTRMPILINLTSGKWTNNLQSDFARRSPANFMFSALKTFYGQELTNE